jgi:hypothetical protein
MKNVLRASVIACLLGAHAGAIAGQPRTVLSGVPSIKISEGGTDRTPQNVTHEDAVNLGCVISEIDGEYYWASRENRPLVRLVSGAFVTYLAADGSGYVRTISPGLKAAASSMSQTEATFDYVEHLLVGLRSVTYYGVAR